jgi:hypothetical protein
MEWVMVLCVAFPLANPPQHVPYIDLPYYAEATFTMLLTRSALHIVPRPFAEAVR